jgi:hypothetical protein
LGDVKDRMDIIRAMVSMKWEDIGKELERDDNHD